MFFSTEYDKGNFKKEPEINILKKKKTEERGYFENFNDVFCRGQWAMNWNKNK